MGGPRNSGPILPKYNTDRAITTLDLRWKFQSSSYFASRDIVEMDGRTDGQTPCLNRLKKWKNAYLQKQPWVYLDSFRVLQTENQN